MRRKLAALAASAALVLTGGTAALAAGSGASAATFCASAPSSCGFPDSSNTGYGVPLSSLKQVNGPIDITTPGTTLSYITTNNTISVDAPNVTITHVRVVVSNGNFGIRLNRAADHTTISHSVIRGSGTTSSAVGIEAIKDIYGTGNSVTAQYLNIYNFGDGIQTYQGNISHNYIHGLVDINGYHLEDVNENGNSGLPLLIQDNTLLNSASQTASVYLGCDFSPTANVTTDHNLMAGGGYSFYGGAGNAGPHCNPSNVKVTNNIFSRVYFPNFGRYGPDAYYSSSAPGDVWSGNRVDNGTAAGGAILNP